MSMETRSSRQKVLTWSCIQPSYADGITRIQWLTRVHDLFLLAIDYTEDPSGKDSPYTGYVVLDGGQIDLLAITDPATLLSRFYLEMHPDTGASICLQEESPSGRWSPPTFSTWDEARNHCLDLFNRYLETVKALSPLEEEDCRDVIDEEIVDAGFEKKKRSSLLQSLESIPGYDKAQGKGSRHGK